MRAKTWIKASRKAGFEISYDWVEAIEKVGQANPVEHAADYARKSFIMGVIPADVVWWLFPIDGHASHGAAFEVGYARAFSVHGANTKLKIIVSGSNFQNSIFTSLCDQKFLSDMDAYVWLREQFWLPVNP